MVKIRFLVIFSVSLLIFAGIYQNISLSNHNFSNYKLPPESIKMEPWIKSKNRRGKIISEGFDCKKKFKNMIFTTPQTKYKVFGGKPLDKKYNFLPKTTPCSTFDLKKIKGKAFGIKALNLKVWNQKHRLYDFVDIKFTFYNWKEVPEYQRSFGPIISIAHKQRPWFAMNGIYSIYVKQEVFKSNTGKPVSILCNTTYKDVDDMQSVDILKGSRSAALDRNTRLLYKNDGKIRGFLNPKEGDNIASDRRNAFAISYKGSELIMKYTDRKGNKGNYDDKLSENNLWTRENNCAYFNAGGAVTLMPKNTKPEITPYRTLNNSVLKNSFVQKPEMNVFLNSSFFDKDHDNLKTRYELYRGQHLIEKGPVKYHSYKTVRKIKSPNIPGKYKIIWFARDYEIYRSKEVKKSLTFKIIDNSKPVSIYAHTKKWEEKRKMFNAYYFGSKTFNKDMSYPKYISHNNIAPGSSFNNKIRGRAPNVFWSGEKISILVKNLNSNTVSCEVSLWLYTKKNNIKKYRLNSSKISSDTYKAVFFMPSWIQKKAIKKPIKIIPHFKIKEVNYYYPRKSKKHKKKPKPIKIVNYFELAEKQYCIILDSFREYSDNHRT